MVIELVKFKSGLSGAEVERVMLERAVKFRALPGLLQKYYAHDKETGEYAGIYLWDSERSLAEYERSDLRKSIPQAYAAQGQPRIERLDVKFLLRD